MITNIVHNIKSFAEVPLTKLKPVPSIPVIPPKIPNVIVKPVTSSEIIKPPKDLNLIDSIKALNDNIQHIINKTGEVWSYITHPGKIVELVWHIVVSNCYVVCIVITFGGLICGLVGFKKGYKIAVISVFVYYGIQIFNSIIGG